MVEASKSREQWIDVFKCFAILLVVFNHLNHFVHLNPMWGSLDRLLQTTRMPTFFLVSGLFAQKALTIAFPKFAETKLWRFGSLYVIWGVFYVLIAAAFSLSAGDGQQVGEEIIAFLTCDLVLWYLPALALFFALARLTKRVAPKVQISVAVLISIPFAADWIDLGSWGANHALQYYPWFLIGLHFSGQIRSFAAGATWKTALGFGMVWLAIYAASYGLEDGWRSILKAVSATASVPMTIAFAVMASHTPLVDVASKVGRNTLPIYVLHYAVLMAILLPIAGTVDQSGLLKFVTPLPAILVAAGLSLGIFYALGRLGAASLFNPPMPKAVEMASGRLALHGARQSRAL